VSAETKRGPGALSKRSLNHFDIRLRVKELLGECLHRPMTPSELFELGVLYAEHGELSALEAVNDYKMVHGE
jgi:hypothetical protein